MIARKFGIAILMIAFLGGCATTAQLEARDKLLGQLRDNLKNDIGPKYKRYLDADGIRAVTLKDNDYGVVSDSIAAIDRVLAPVTSDAK